MSQCRFYLSISFIVALTGCFSLSSNDGEQVQQAHYYVIDVSRPVTAESFAQNRSLLVKPVRVVPHFRGQQLMFRVGDKEYQAQQGQEFIIEPSDMFTSQVSRWLKKSGLFSQVTTDNDINTDYILESAVTGLYGDARPESTKQAIVEMQFFLYFADNPDNLAFQTGLQVSVDVDNVAAPDVVTAWNQGLFELLTNLEQDFSGYFSKLGSR